MSGHDQTRFPKKEWAQLVGRVWDVGNIMTQAENSVTEHSFCFLNWVDYGEKQWVNQHGLGNWTQFTETVDHYAQHYYRMLSPHALAGECDIYHGPHPHEEMFHRLNMANNAAAQTLGAEHLTRATPTHR